MTSPYAKLMPLFVQQLDQAFTNVMHLTQPYQLVDHLPSDAKPGDVVRYGVLDLQSYGSDDNRPELNRVRGGVEAKSIGGRVLLTLVFDADGMEDGEIYRKVNTLFLQECLNLEDAISDIKGQLHDQQCLYEMDLKGDIVKATSVRLRDKKTWIVDITVDVLIRLMVKRAIDGQHVLPITS